MYELDQSALGDFVNAVASGRAIFALEQADTTFHPEAGGTPAPDYHLVRCESWEPARHTLGAYRPVEPLKAVMFPPREAVGLLDAPDSGLPEFEERVVVGVKNCDLSALRIHDYVFRESEPVDPFYDEARRKTALIACDCTDARDACFCPLVGERPFAEAGFDINLSPTRQGILVESGSPWGEELLRAAEKLLRPAGAGLVERRDRDREALQGRLRERAEARGPACDSDLRTAVQATAESGLWEDFARDCVECGACNFCCCTCHCFLLADGLSGNGRPARVKKWDSCLYRDFARVAGGANPRRHRAERLYNRFDKKFSFFPQVLDRYACDGCGRCIEACTGKIDIREVLKRVVDES